MLDLQQRLIPTLVGLQEVTGELEVLLRDAVDPLRHADAGRGGHGTPHSGSVADLHAAMVGTSLNTDKQKYVAVATGSTGRSMSAD